MLEDVCDLFTEPADAKCITTNGYIKANGRLVMGAGVAGAAQARYPNFPKVAGEAVKQYGNIVHAFHSSTLRTNTMFEPSEDQWYVTFPVKHVWYEDADLDLIERSAGQLMDMLNEPAFKSWKKVLLPRPGCGNGRLTWGQVEPVIAPILDDRIVVVRSPY
jgi:O-acetyl-ADP-ribose deacetylase (regulator of RNase III)